MKIFIKKFGLVLLMMALVVELNPVQISATVSKPSIDWNLNPSKNGRYSGSGSAQVSNLYSNYNFTKVAKMRYEVVNTGDNDITVNIYRTDAYVSYYRIKVEAHSTAIWTMNTNSTKKYYVRFSAPCKFKYTVTKG